MSQPLPEARKCVVCGKAQDAKHRPFCSRRCADVDLGKWLGGRYAIPAEEPPDSGPQAAEEDE
jgi:uncharacterized protein